MENAFINQVKSELGEYGKAVGNIGRLRLIGIISRALGLFLFILTVVLCALALFTFCAVAAIDAMSVYMPVWAAALIIGSAYVVLIIIAIIGRKPLFVHPFIKMLSKQISTEDELKMQTMEAENKAALQLVRMETRVENATREIELYVNIFSRLWKFIRRLFKK